MENLQYNTHEDLAAINEKYSGLAPTNQSNVSIDMKRQAENNRSVADIQNAGVQQGLAAGREEGFNAGSLAAQQKFNNQDIGYGVTRNDLMSAGLTENVGDETLMALGQQKIIDQNNLDRRTQPLQQVDPSAQSIPDVVTNQEAQIAQLAKEMRMTPDEVVALISQA